MGFLKPDPPKIPKPPEPEKEPVKVIQQAPTVDDESVRKEGEAVARRAAQRRNVADTSVTKSKRRRGGLASAARSKVGG